VTHDPVERLTAECAAFRAAAAAFKAERDAARAEVAALRDELERAPDGWEVVVARKAVLADLRAKVEALRDLYQKYLDSGPTEQERGRAWSRVDSLNGVLVLIEEAGNVLNVQLPTWPCCEHCWSRAPRPCPDHHSRRECRTWHSGPCPDCQRDEAKP
jgi:uncharacterized protein YukE